MTSPPQNVDQSDSNVLGDQVGRDQYKTTIFSGPAPAATAMDALIAKYQQEVDAQSEVGQTIDELQRWLVNRHTDQPRNLEAKFSDGKRNNDLRFAEQLKESFAKKLQRNQFYESAQKIIAYTLALVRHRFMCDVVPLLANDATKAEVTAAIHQHVIKVTINELKANPMILDHGEIEGMIYFLMSKCWLDWVAERC